jgi:cell division protein ZapA
MADNLEVRRATTSISVDIYDQTYHLRAHDPDYIQKLASTVDAKMRAVSASGNTVDSLRVAVLAALNIGCKNIAVSSAAP